MELNQLIERIRKEEVALVIGSGLSLYAGYVGAGVLREMILEESLNYCDDPAERASLQHKTLAEIADCLVRYNGNRDTLNRILLREYKKQPTATDVHDVLGRIPHFDHIFTTNYDTLIEDCMDKRCHVIVRESDFPFQGNKFPKVYKLHGDVNHLEGIVITSKDYLRTTISQQQHLIWNRLRDIAATKDFLFLGHGFEDSNIWGIFDLIKERLAGSKRQKYIICPSLPSHQQLELGREGFVHFAMNGEQFLNELRTKLQEYAVMDLHSGELSLQTFQKFLAFNDHGAIISTKDQQVQVDAIIERDGLVHQQVDFVVLQQAYEEFLRFRNGEIRGRSFTFPKESVKKLDGFMSGYKIFDETTIGKFEFLKLPDHKLLDVESEDGVVNFTDIKIEQYSYTDGAELEFWIHQLKFTMSFTFEEDGIRVNVNFGEPPAFRSAKEAIETLQFIAYIFNGKKLDFSFDKQSPFAFGTEKKARLEIQGQVLEHAIAHYSDLRVLEKRFKIRFTNLEVSKISPEPANGVAKLAAIIRDGFYEHDFATGIYLPDQLTEYKSTEGPTDLTSELNLILETAKMYEFYGVKLPTIYPTITVLEPDFLKEGEHYGVKSMVGKVRHSFLDQSQFEDFKTLQQGSFPVAKFINERVKNGG